MRKWIEDHDRQVLRALEILPGFFSWNLILLPYWGIFLFPTFIAYFVLFFNIYWFWQSFQIAVSAIVSHLRVQAAKIYDWMGDVRGFPDWQKVRHVVIVPTYKEPGHILARTLNSLSQQDFPAKQLIVVLATEEVEPKENRLPKVAELKKKFDNAFGAFVVTTHKLAPGEVAGKAPNERYAAIWVRDNIIKPNKLNLDYFTVTSCDADTVFPKSYFSCLTFKFLDDPERYNRFWQGPVLYYNNIWALPALTRVPNTLATIYNLALISRRERLINLSTYSLSFKLLDEVDYWDPDKIPEDWGIFFKSYYKKQGKVEVEPIYLPIYVDAPQSTGFFKTLVGQYETIKRHAWGVSDDPWIIKNYFLVKGIPFFDKTLRLIHVFWSHFMWPVNWFVITLGLTVPSLLNPAFGRTALGYTVPRLSSLVLTFALVFLLVMIYIDNIYKPKRPEHVTFLRGLLLPLEFFLMPISGFIFGALPGIDAHTRLMLGKYLKYKVTEKV